MILTLVPTTTSKNDHPSGFSTPSRRQPSLLVHSASALLRALALCAGGVRVVCELGTGGVAPWLGIPSAHHPSSRPAVGRARGGPGGRSERRMHAPPRARIARKSNPERDCAGGLRRSDGSVARLHQ